ncbi:GNAT family N-acetyltransferase [Erythrobacter sp. WH131]|uniref:GNAT family N-acetyltransferase n=1 Tax=Erythrobacter ani TaxID=2827235 RepID=A0ABS6SNU7_9SPHN|nr:GNAT family N-acetyltransferase [Erythrobacter ani]
METRLENGSPVCIRTIREEDRELMRVGIEKMSQRSRYLRFFSGARSAPEWVIERLVAADGHDHIAWGALDMAGDDKPAIGAVHAFRDEEDDDCAEFSVAVLDEYHGLGLGKLLTATILLDAREEAITEFEVNILADNAGAKDFTRSLGGRLVDSDRDVLEYVLDVETAIVRLKADCDPPGITEVFKAFA